MTDKEAAKRGLDWWNSAGRRESDSALVAAIGRLLAERDALLDGMAREAAERYRLNRAMVALANGELEPPSRPAAGGNDPDYDAGANDSLMCIEEWATRVLSDTTLYGEEG